MSAALRYRALLDGTTADAARQARALTAFVNGLPAAADQALTGETVVFCPDPAAGRELARLAPTGDVRLVPAPPRRPELMVERLLALGDASGVDLYLAAPGSTGAELVTRLACRTSGAALGRVLDLELAGHEPGDAPGALAAHCRTTLYSGHLAGRFELRRRPWCLSLDAAWADERPEPPAEHRLLSVGDTTAGVGASAVAAATASEGAAGGAAPAGEPFADIELIAAPADDLAEARFLVVAGYGAGREGVARLAAAARRMGAAFGVSRPVAMSAWAPLDRLVGASGARTAPLVCIVAAASGAPALYWGIERAAFVAALNTDEHAPIVRVADAVVVGDAVEVVEALAALVADLRA